MFAQPAMLLSGPPLVWESKPRLALVAPPGGGRYDGTPGTSERRLSALLAIGASTALLASLLAIHGKEGSAVLPPATVTTFSVAAAPAAEQPAPATPPPPQKSQPAPAAERVPPRIASHAPPQLSLPLALPAAQAIHELAASGGQANTAASVAFSTTTGSQGSTAASGPDGTASEMASAAVGPPTRDAATDRYARRVFEKIRREQSYEAVLRRDALAGTVVLAFTVDRRGQLRGQRVTIPSPHPAIDRIALRHLAEAAPFPRPPQGKERTFQIPLTYRQSE
ncbi:TonB family protein [Aurantiacibacter xanthus]|uniref:TonB family protein n=1 Tax=Aurantiacibacter xanthus TaxID=1784712 RepID=A0A3A1P5M9_9SPHN|nr:TonB family protein [Aurantiacibacter xanthus]RIV86110.1 TonB family protein [Aurantiacibacter xanthus]